MSDRSPRRSLHARFTRRRRHERQLTGTGRAFHLVGAVALLLGLFLQVLQYQDALASAGFDRLREATNQSAEVAPAPQQVVAVGDFQAQLGCADFDANCGASALGNQGGFWAASFPLPPGSYEVGIAAIGGDGQVYLYGEGGLNGNSASFEVGDNQVGVYISFDQSSQQIEVDTLDQLVQLNTDAGTIPLNADGEGIVFSGGGSVQYQTLVNGEPVAEGSFDVEDGPNRVQVGNDGQVGNVEGLGYATLQVTRTQGGEPAPGGCYEVRDGNDVVGRGCDIDDGNADGQVTIVFAGGVDFGQLQLREVVTPDGAESADDQDVDIQEGDNAVEVATDGGISDDSQDSDDQGQDDGTIDVLDGDTTDDQQDTQDTGDQQDADDQQDTQDSADQQDSGDQQDSEDQQDTQDTADQQDTDGEDTIDVLDGDGEEPTEEPQGGPGDLIVTLTDQDGNPIPDACFELTDEGGQILQSCDRADSGDSNPGNGNTGFFGIPSGTYQLTLTEAPEGVETGEAQEVEVLEGQSVNVTYETSVEAAEEPTETPTEEASPTEEPTEDAPANGGIVIVRQDQDGNPVAGGCYVLFDANGERFGDEICDSADGDDGRTGISDLPAGTYVLRETTTPDGVEPAEDQQVEVAADESTEIVAATARIEDEEPTEEASPTEEPTEEGEDTIDVLDGDGEEPTEEGGSPADGPPGDLIVELADQDGNPIPNACFELRNPDDSVAFTSCDRADFGDSNPDNGRTGFFGIPSGDYTLELSEAPEGVEAGDPQPVTVEAGTSTTINVTANAATEPTQEASPTEEPAPTEEPTDEGEDTIDVLDGDGEEPTTEPEGDGGGVRIDLGVYGQDDAGICVAFDTTGAIGLASPPTVCDNGDGDLDPAQGIIEAAGIPAGDYSLRFIPSADTEIPDQPVTIADGETADVALEAPAPTTGTITIVTEGSASESGEAEPIAGACYDLGNESGTFAFCDEDGDGTITVPDVAFGETTITQTSTREGFSVVDEAQTVTLSEDAPDAEVRFVNQPAPGSVAVTLEAGDGAIPVEGTCVQVGETQLCDNGEGDVDPAVGVILFEDVTPGEYTVVVTSAPEGYAVPEIAGSVTVVAGSAATVSMPLTEAGPTTGSITVAVTVDDAPIPVEGTCIALSGLETRFCDNGDGDGDPATGTILIQDVEPGEYSVSVASTPQGYLMPDTAVEATVIEGETVQVSLPITEETPRATLVITVTDVATGDAIPGGCFDISNESGTTQTCDDDNDGTITVPEVPFGAVTVTQTSAAEGYDVAAEAQQAELSEDAPEASLAFENAETVTTGSFTITVTDAAAGNAIPAGCFDVINDAGTFQLCDDDNDGTITATEVPFGTSTVTQTSAGEGYEVATEAQQVELSAEAPESTVAFTNAAVVTAVDVSVSTSDGQGGVPTGACYAIDGGDPLCDSDGDGIVIFEGVEPGSHTFTQTTAPAGYEIAAEQTVEIVPGETEGVTFVNDQALNGSLLVRIVDADGAAVPGIDVTVQNVGTISDGGATDPDGAAGQVIFEDLEPGDYTIGLGSVPETYVVPDDQPVTVVASEQVTLTFELAAAEDQTGGLEITLQDTEGNPVEGGCVTLTNSALGEELGPFCDDGEGDTNTESAALTVEDIPVGTWSVEGVSTSEGEVSAAATQRKSVQVQAAVIVVIIIIIPPNPVDGQLQFSVRDSETDAYIPNTCWDIDNGSTTVSVCDNDATDGNGTVGVVRLTSLAPGEWDITLADPVPGYEQNDVPTATIELGVLTQLRVDLDPTDEFGTVIVNKLDETDDALPGACFALRQNGVIIYEQCDDTDTAPNDGQVIFGDVPAGIYRLIETRTPGSEYGGAENVQITVVAGETEEYDRVNTLRPSDLVVRKVDAADGATLLPGACFELRDGSGETIFGPFCDGDDLTNDGRTRFNDVPVGTYELVETVAPYGYQVADSRDVEIQPGGFTQVVNVENELLPPPDETGDLIVYKEDQAGKILPGACFRLYSGNNPLTNTVCDGSDGSNDGVIRFSDVPVGEWSLRETVVPSPSYQAASPTDVTIEQDETTEVTVENVLKTGRIRIEKTNPSGQALQNACFDLLEDNGGEKCTDTNGVVVFENIASGTYTIRETKAPYGYQTAADKKNVVVNPGKTTTVKLVNQLIPPDPDTGSVQVLSFTCPAGEGDERTIFLGGQAGSEQLAKTAGCTQGNAAFNLDQDNGNGGPGDFTTGGDGRYQVSVPSGTYTLTETDPDLPGDSDVKVAVYKNQLTTVVVINYVKPPEPDPITVNVVKWTCAPSFTGTLYDDFAQNCTEDTQLTNNITFRVEGPVTQKHVTGDGGKVGQTSFTGLSEGQYSIYEETPYSIPTSYGFCGYDASWPADLKVVNGAVNVSLGWGETLTCHFFNIPEDVTDTTGVVLVRKFTCDIEKAPKGYDWFEECGLSDQNAKFALNSYNVKTGAFQEYSQGTANNDGFLRFTRLKPGTYELKEIGDTWCHAESDSVDSKGNVVVKAGKVSTVWIFNCVPTKTPPNTGSGDAAPNAPTDGEGEYEGGVAPSFALGWPILLGVAWFLWRRRPVYAPARRLVSRDHDRAA